MLWITHALSFHLITLLSLLFLFFTSTTLLGAKRYRSEWIDTIEQEEVPFYFRLHKFFFGAHITPFLFALTITQYVLIILFLTGYIIPILTLIIHENEPIAFITLITTLSFLVMLSALIFFGDSIPRKWSQSNKEAARLCFVPATIPLLCTFPITLLFHSLLSITGLDSLLLPYKESKRASKEKLLELIEEADSSGNLNIHDKKLLQAVVTFRDRITREVMVPRINLFCLADTVTIQDAVTILEKENYSRIPVFRDTIDSISGVLMYKDLLFAYTTAQETHSKPISTLVKPVMYVPETQKLSQLLQDFRRKKRHMAIVVDEYGGTSGIVTIEDILEEIVGEIADEYDEEMALFKNVAPHVWIIDAKANLLDLEEETGIHVPHTEEYDTIAGFIFHQLGVIPEKGTVVHRDTFEIEVVSCNDRAVEKVKITELST